MEDGLEMLFNAAAAVGTVADLETGAKAVGMDNHNILGLRLRRSA